MISVISRLPARPGGSRSGIRLAVSAVGASPAESNEAVWQRMRNARPVLQKQRVWAEMPSPASSHSPTS